MIRKYLDISTAHVKNENRHDILETNIYNLPEYSPLDVAIYGFPYDSGTFISVCTENKEDLNALREMGAEEIADILEFCLDNGITLIRFDSDAPVMDEFPTFEWLPEYKSADFEEEEFAKNPPVDQQPEWLTDEDQKQILDLLSQNKKIGATKVVVDKSKDEGVGLWNPIRWGKMYVEYLQSKQVAGI